MRKRLHVGNSEQYLYIIEERDRQTDRYGGKNYTCAYNKHNISLF